jgi:hypothetical protein
MFIGIKQFCVDESGDIGYTSKSSRYFVLCAVGVENLDALRRVARDVHRSKYAKKKGNILHAYKESDVIRNKIIKKLEKLDVECVACIVDKQKVKAKDVYIYATDVLAKYLGGKNVELIIVARKDNRKSYAKNILDIYSNKKIHASFSDPAKDKSLQIADFYSWSVYSKYEKEKSEYFGKLKNISLI